MKWHLSHPRYGKKPWAVQAEAKRRSEGVDRYFYALEQGLGKSPLSLNDVVHYLELGVIDRAVVVAPNSFKLDWSLLPGEWGRPEIRTGYWPRNKPSEDVQLYAINYEAVRTSAGKELTRLFSRARCMLIIDESAAMQNPFSATSRALHELSKDAAMVRELNGTPMTNNVMDLFMQLKVLGELDGVNPYAFRNRHAVMGGYMGRQIQRDEIRNADELYAILDRVSFRALKKDWRKDLPPQVFTPIHLEMTARQRQHYREMLEEFFTVVNDLEVSADMVLTQMEKLRQISSCVAMQSGKAAFFEPKDKNPKVAALLDLLHSCSGKVMIPYVYRATGAMLYDVLSDEKLKPAWIRGGVKPEVIVEEKRRFNDDPDCRVVLAQEEASYRGHTLLGGEGRDRCSTMAFFETSFSYYHRSQIQDRIHRGEQDETCNYYDFVISPIEQTVLEALAAKKNMADALDAVIAVVRKEARD